MPPSRYDAARTFVRGHARILEQRLADSILDGADPAPVAAAVAAYRNPDGGFGHALEPDTRCPRSQPLFAQIALESLARAGAPVDGMVLAALCDHLAAVAGPGPAVPLMLPGFADWPRAAHWQGVSELPSGLNPTAALVGLLHRFGAAHPWLDDATAWCLDTLAADGIPADAHTIGCVLVLLEHVPDRDRAASSVEMISAALDGARHFRADPDDPEYGLTPLDLAPRPDGPWRRLFADDVVAGHLDALERDQEPDGGWPIRWSSPTEVSRWEWRGIVTVQALSTLRAYGHPGW